MILATPTRDRCQPCCCPVFLKVLAFLLFSVAAFFAVMIFYVARPDPSVQISVDKAHPLPNMPWGKDSKGIPLILHQMWKNEHIPKKWTEAQRTCLQLNQEYTLIMWTDDILYNFIYEKYPWFYNLFVAYPYHIQRVDVARYFLLHFYGGVYLDIDVECHTPFRSLIGNMSDDESVYLVEARIDGVTNSFMASTPASQFFQHVIYQLPAYARGMFNVLRHTTIIFSTGPQFLTRCVESYPNRNQLHVMDLSDFYNKHFTNFQAGTWHSWDTEVVELVQFHYITVLIIIGVLVLVIASCKKYKLHRQLSSQSESKSQDSSVLNFCIKDVCVKFCSFLCDRTGVKRFVKL